MRKNIGVRDKITRVLLALAVVTVLYFSDNISESTAIILLVVSLVSILTATVGVCPLYIPFGINTKKSEK